MPETRTRDTTLPLLTLDDVSRRFGARTVVNRVTLAIDPGEIHLLVGPNGSGKSTLARLAAGLLRPHAGEVRIGTADPRTAPAVRSLIGYLGHESQLYDDLTPAENLTFGAGLHGTTDPAAAARAALLKFEVDPGIRTPVRRLSRGYIQRTALARSVAHAPRLLIWDEPLTGLDAASVARTIAVLRAEREAGTALLLISHDLPALWDLDARVHVIHQGELVLSTSMDDTLATFQRQYAELTA